MDLLNMSDLDDIASFVPSTYECFLAAFSHNILNRELLHLYFDSKVEKIFLESRATRLAILLERLKHTFTAAEPKIPENILSKSAFKKVSRNIKDCIKQAFENLKIRDDTLLKDMLTKVAELNRKPFGSVIKAVVVRLGLQDDISDRDLKLFIKCRNSLIHRGSFYCKSATREERDKCEPLPSAWDEYLFLLHMINIIFMALVGYSGKFLDIRRKYALG